MILHFLNEMLLQIVDLIATYRKNIYICREICIYVEATSCNKHILKNGHNITLNVLDSSDLQSITNQIFDG